MLMPKNCFWMQTEPNTLKVWASGSGAPTAKRAGGPLK